MTAAKTPAQWRREVPAYDKAYRAVKAMLAEWPGRPPHMVAHLNPDTRVVSIVLHGDRTDAVDFYLAARFDYPTGGWTQEHIQGVTIRRKTLTR